MQQWVKFINDLGFHLFWLSLLFWVVWSAAQWLTERYNKRGVTIKHKICMNCEGNGEVTVTKFIDGSGKKQPCYYCEGRGVL